MSDNIQTVVHQPQNPDIVPQMIRADYVMIFSLGVVIGLWLAFKMTSVGVEKSTITRKNYFLTRN